MDADVEMGANNPIDIYGAARFGSAVTPAVAAASSQQKHDLTQAEFDNEWLQLQTFLRRLIEEPKGITSREWQQWIERVHRLCVCAPPLPQTQDGYAWPLYQKVNTFLNEYVTSIYDKLCSYSAGRQLRSTGDDMLLLDSYLVEWRKWIDASRVINDVLLHLNTNGKRKNAFQEHFNYRFINIQNLRGAGGGGGGGGGVAGDQDDDRQYEVRDLFKVIWNACIVNKLETRLKDCLMHLVHRDRVSHDSDVFRKLCTVTSSLVDLDNIDGRHRQLETYVKIFEHPFITTTGEYYQAESIKLLKTSTVSAYMEKVLSRLKEEEDRAKDLCHATSHQKVRREIQLRMVQDHLHVLVAECKAMVEERRDYDLRNMYRILRPAQTGMDQFIETLRMKIQADMREALRNVLPLLHVDGGGRCDMARAGQTLLKMFHGVLHTYRTLQRELFDNDYDVNQAIDKAVRASLNDGSVLPQDRVPEMLAVYSDRLLRGLFDPPVIPTSSSSAGSIAAERTGRGSAGSSHVVSASGSGDGLPAASSSLMLGTGTHGGFDAVDLLANDADMEVPPARAGSIEAQHNTSAGSDDAAGTGGRHHGNGHGDFGDTDDDDDAGQYLSQYKDVASPSSTGVVGGVGATAVQKLAKLISSGPRKAKIDETIEVFSFTEEKEVFRKAYQILLAKRLINKAYKKLDEEAYFVEQLRLKCGYDFANKLWRMVQDARMEHEIHRRFVRRWLAQQQRMRASGAAGSILLDPKLKSIKHEEDEDDMPPASGGSSNAYQNSVRLTTLRRTRVAAAAAAATNAAAAAQVEKQQQEQQQQAETAEKLYSNIGSTPSPQQLGNGVDFHVNVLTTSAWPVSDEAVKISQNFRLPRQLEQIADQFMRFYGEEYNCRTLRWVYSLGYAEIELSFIAEKQLQRRITTRLRAAELAEPCTAIVSNYQCALLMYLNDENEHDSFMLSDVSNITGLPEQEVLPHLRALVQSGLLLATKVESTSKTAATTSAAAAAAVATAGSPLIFMSTTVFSVNENFVPPRGVHRLRLTPSMMRNSAGGADGEHCVGGGHGGGMHGAGNGSGMDGDGRGGAGGSNGSGGRVGSMRTKSTSFAHNPDKRNAIQAAVIRLLKKNQHMEHDALVALIRKTLSGLLGDAPSEEDLLENFPLDEIKTTIETLIDKEYVRRDEQHTHVYHYVP